MNRSYRKRLLVGGRVQGVGFRYFTIRLAEDYGINGYVRNLPDGQVEIVAEGEKQSVDGFIEKASKGPWSARVTEVKTFIETPEGQFESFGVRY